MQDYDEIRRRFLAGESQRHIAKAMGISRNTVKKYCEGNAVPWERKTPDRESTILTPDVVEFIQKCLEEGSRQGLKKQKYTAKRIYDRLVEETGFTGGESTVRAKVHELKECKPKAFIPLQFEPGEAMQVDWGELPSILMVGKQLSIFSVPGSVTAAGRLYLLIAIRMKRVSWTRSFTLLTFWAESREKSSSTMVKLL